MAITKTATKKTASKTSPTRTATKATGTATKKKAKVTPRQAAKNKTATKRTAKRTAIKTSARKTAKKLTAKTATTTASTAATTAVRTTTKKTTAKKPTAKKTAASFQSKKSTAKTATKTTAKTTTKSPTLTTGTTAPNFTLPTDNGTVTLTQLRGKNVVLYFYPKDDTPGCTTEACGFRDNLPKFNTLNATVIGISKDSTASHKKFKAKYKLPFTLASDETGDVCTQYGAYGTKSMYGKTFTGVLRTTFLIDATGTIRAIWRNVNVTGHVDTVAETLKTLGTTTTGKTTTSKKKAA